MPNLRRALVRKERARHSGDAPGASSREHQPVATVRVKTCLLVPDHHGEEIPLGPGMDTVGALLRYLGERSQFELVDGAGNVVKDIDVSINDKDLNFCPAGLATPLRPDDRISIYLVPVGGG
jgi:hypothetical protein